MTVFSVTHYKWMDNVIWVSGKKRTPYGPADPDGSQKIFNFLHYTIKMYYYIRLFR